MSEAWNIFQHPVWMWWNLYSPIWTYRITPLIGLSNVEFRGFSLRSTMNVFSSSKSNSIFITFLNYKCGL